MLERDRRLIEELRERNADRQRATDGGTHPRRAAPPVTRRELRKTERALGFALPEIVGALFSGVANGGFGPAYGIVGTGSGVKLDGESLPSCYRSMLALQDQNPVWRWPRGLLPIANYGCGMWSSVDCEYRRLPMIIWDPNNLDEDLSGAEAKTNWGNAFWDQGLTLHDWLGGWLKGTPAPEPKWPSDSWMKKRLGLKWPKR